MSFGSFIHYYTIKFLVRGLHIDLAKNMPIPPKKYYQSYMVSEKQVNGQNVFYIQQQKQSAYTAIIYLHGGGYKTNFTPQHWYLINHLLKCTKVDLICPDYPLIPNTYEDSYRFLEKLYDELIRVYPSIIIMGDSAGGGFAYGFTQYLRNIGKTLPTKLILISPWLDVSMSNQEIEEVMKYDPWLDLDEIVPIGKQYALGNTKHYMVSPIYGDFTGLPPTLIITGTYDILYPDIKLLNNIAQTKGYPIKVSVYEKMLHVFPLLFIKEGKAAIKEMIEAICEGEAK